MTGRLRVTFADGPLIGHAQVLRVPAPDASLTVPLEPGWTVTYRVVGGTAYCAEPPGPDWRPGESLRRYLDDDTTARPMYEVLDDDIGRRWDELTLDWDLTRRCVPCDVGWAGRDDRCWCCGGPGVRSSKYALYRNA